MPWNPFKKKHTYVKPSGPITITRRQFKVMLRSTPALRKSYLQYSAATSLQLANCAMDYIYTESLRGMTPGGKWVFGGTYGGATIMSFDDENGLEGFLGAIEMMIDFDINKIADRRRYIVALKARAQRGDLKTQLDLNTEPEANYYTAPPPLVVVFGPQPKPPTQQEIELDKAVSFLEHGIYGNAAAYGQKLRELAKHDGTFPLGNNDTILRNAWGILVVGAPAYRGWNSAATQQKYPSDSGGAKLLNDILMGMSTTPMPAQGADRWYDYALYLYGGIMTAQPFTDGNKRLCRLVYTLMLVSGGVPFKAPNTTFGSRLADMM